MKHLTYIISVLCSLPLVPSVVAADWQPAAGPLKTRWAKDVAPDHVLPEYPRPQMVRKDWLNLNGLWDIKLGDGTESKILVPFAIESALSGVMKHVDHVTYRRSFEIPKDWSGQQVLLHFGAVDWETTVSLNGRKLGVHRGGYDAFSFDITEALKQEGTQEITVEVFDPTDLGGQPRGKQKLKPGSIMYTPTTGIWQTVWLEPVPGTHIESLKIVPEVDQGSVRIKVAAVAGKDDGNLLAYAEVYDGQTKVGEAKGWASEELVVKIPNAKLWSPETPFLYNLKITSSGQRMSRQVDSVTSYFGMRKIALGKDDQGVTRMMINGKPVFQVGPLDQGFWPDGIYTAPTDEALRFDVAETKRLGFNTTRKHVKVEPDRWYYWCDKLGLLVWQDMPCGNSYTDKPQPIDKPQFNSELVNMVKNHWNHPSIIMWVVFNENQGQHDTEALVAEVKALDPSRLVNNASGNDDKNCGDVIDKHSYPGPESPKPEEQRAAVLGEFGGLGLPVDGHTWSHKTWGYEGTKSIADLTSGYEKLLVKAWDLNATAGLSAVIYTQLTDVETECNGLLTYDREINKVVPERATAANSGKLENASPVPPTETQEAREQRIQWFREARFGMFIHWGLYAIPGGTWKDKVHASGYSEWIMFGEKIPAKEYAKLADKFNPVKFDAKAWAGIARKAGMKYMVLTTKHHDGFSMFQSSLTPYNVADATPFKRDVTRELVDACRDCGLRFGCYYSIDRDWYRPQGPGNHYKQANVWDFPDSKREDFDRYFTTFSKPQVEELLTKYRPDLLWFDEIDMKTDAQVEDLYQTIRRLRPECVINSRIQGCRFPERIPPPHCDYISTGDNEIADKNLGFEWENPGSMNTSYGFSANDHNWVSASEIVSRLVEIVSKGGNYLLNVGPTPEGLIPQPCIDRLAEVGGWMDVNGEAIYGTSPWRVFHEKNETAGCDIRFTAKGHSVYVFCPSRQAGELTIKALGKQPLAGQQIVSVVMLGCAEKINWSQTGGGLTLTVPPAAPGRFVSTYRIDLQPVHIDTPHH